MPKPWEKYQSGGGKPWERYGAPATKADEQQLSSAQQVLAEPFQRGKQFARDFDKNPRASVYGIINAAADVPFSIPQAGLAALKTSGIPGAGVAADVISFPFGLLQKGIHAGVGGLADVAESIGRPIDEKLGVAPNEEAIQQLRGMAERSAAYGLAAKAPETAKIADQIATKARQTTADALSQSAFKVPPSIRGAKRSEILHTAQEYGITPRAKGLEKLDNRVVELKSVAESLEKKATSSGAKIPTADLVKSIDGLIERWSKGDTPASFKKVLENYKDAVTKQQKAELTIPEMVDLKRNLQTQLTRVYAQQMKINPSIRQSLVQEAKSALEVSVRKKLEELIPEYKNTNSQIHRLLNLKPFVEQAANRISNYDLLNVRFKDLFFGGAGVGKTFYIKHLAGLVKRRFIFIPTGMVDSIVHPSLIKVLMDNPNSILVLEDAEKAVISREHDDSNSSLVSAILNLSDGILSSLLNTSLIVTFNTERQKIDKAILRKGRLFAEHKFDKLSIEESKKLAKHLNKNVNITEPMSLAEIYNDSEDNFHTEEKNRKIGFQVI